LPADIQPAQCVVAYEAGVGDRQRREPRPRTRSPWCTIVCGSGWWNGSVAEGGAIRLLYGGSAKPANAGAIVRIAHVDGLLVGGASLAADDFWAICVACA